MIRIAMLAVLVGLVLLPAKASAAANGCVGDNGHGSVTLICRVSHISRFQIHLTANVSENRLRWSLDCGGGAGAIASMQTVGKRYDIRVDKKTNPAAYASMSRHACVITATAKLTRPGALRLKVAAT